MKKLHKNILALVAVMTLAIGLLQISPAYAASVTTHVKIVGTERTIWYGDVTIEGCTITDTADVTHTYTQPVALCAVDQASKTGNFTYKAKDFGGSLGLFLEGIAEDTGAADFSTYWLYDINGQGASSGVASYVVNAGDSLTFHFENPASDPNMRALNDGIAYLRNQQLATGQISGFAGITDWSAITFSAAGINPNSVSNNGTSLTGFMSSNPPADAAAATEWERSLLAVTAAGENPYTFGGINYVTILEGFSNNSQLGVVTQVNDDMFGLLALIASGTGSSQIIKQNALNFILSHQETDGAFSWSTTGTPDIDTTAAGLQALLAAQKAGMTATGLATGIANATTYLLGAQNPDGGFPSQTGDVSNASTTAWVSMAFNAAGLNGTENTNAKSYLRTSQEENGSFRWQQGSAGDTFTTSYAVHALTGKYWPVTIYTETVPTPTVTITPTATPTPTPTPTPNVSVTPSPTVSPTSTPLPSQAVTSTPTVTVIPTIIPNPTITPKPNPRNEYREMIRQQKERMRQIQKEQKRIMKEMQELFRKQMREMTDMLKSLRQR